MDINIVHLSFYYVLDINLINIIFPEDVIIY